MTRVRWIRLLIGCPAKGCQPGDVLRFAPTAPEPMVRIRDGLAILPNAGRLALALAEGWVVVIPAALRAVS